FDLFDQMVISDDDGKVIFNAAQQDSKVMRVVFRVGFQVANPVTRVNTNGATRYPAGVVTPAEEAWSWRPVSTRSSPSKARPPARRSAESRCSTETVPRGPAARAARPRGAG